MPAIPDKSAIPAGEPVTPSQPQIVYVQTPRRPTVLWVLAIVLAVIATAMVMRWDESAWLRSAFAQAGSFPRSGMEGARGIYAFTGQISSRSYGLFMVDVDTGTVWCYELERKDPNAQPHLKLVAARSWVFDRYLEEFNTTDPIPSEVRALVQQQRSNRSPASQPAASPASGSDSP